MIDWFKTQLGSSFFFVHFFNRKQVLIFPDLVVQCLILGYDSEQEQEVGTSESAIQNNMIALNLLSDTRSRRLLTSS